MPTCEKCGLGFKNHAWINGKLKNLQNRRFCINCSPYGKHNTRDLTKPITDEKLCCRCNQILKASQFYRRKRNASELTSYCKECLKNQAMERVIEMKKLAVKYKGGKCIVCGYSKTMRNLHFHHVNRAEKDFEISQIRASKLEKIKPELDKCILVCSNCHGEIEDGMIQIDPSWHPRQDSNLQPRT